MHRGRATWSLRRRLAAIATFALATAVVAGGAAMYSAAAVQESQMLDAHLEQLGSAILSIVDDEFADDPGTVIHTLKTRPTTAMLYRYQVWTSDGRLVVRSHEAPPDRPWADLKTYGFSRYVSAGEEYRTFAAPSRDGRFVVQIAESVDGRLLQLAKVTSYYVAFLLLPFGLILATTDVLMRLSLASVQVIAAQLTNRNPMDVTELRVDRPPEEMLPILRSLDELFARMSRTLSVERRFTAVAAHEMRTPLAGVRAQAQLAATAATVEESRAALEALMRGVDRASHLLTQLLDIARVEGMGTGGPDVFTSVDMHAVCDDALSDVQPLAYKKQVTIATDLQLDHIDGIASGLLLLVRNLVSNAVRSCPEGGHVHIAVRRELDRVVLTVDDTGPGLPPEERERAFERFNRLERRHRDGVGLGLSIVLMVAELHAAKVALVDSPMGGLRCRVDFGAARPEPHPAETAQLACV
jgi:signal transduction histidine kinase